MQAAEQRAPAAGSFPPTSSRVRKVLVISFDFPPRRTSAVYRIKALTKYLVDCHWQPLVLTVQGPVQLWSPVELKEDPALLQGIPSQVRVVRTPIWRLLEWESLASATVRRLGYLPSTDDGAGESCRDRWVRSAARRVRSLLYFPDASVGWIAPALRAAVELHFEQRFDAIYTTSPPRAATVVGLILHRIFGLPWVAEFMDPWYPPPGRIRRDLEHRLQARVVRSADRVVVVTPGHADDLGDSFPVVDGKLAVIPNGYDEQDFAGLPDPPPRPPGDKVHFSHFGTVYPGHSGEFFPALAELVRESPGLRRRLQIDVVGFPDETVRRFASPSELGDVVRLHGYMPHEQALNAMYNSDALLLFLADAQFSRLAVSSKIYEYLRVGRPIVAVAYDGGVKRLIREAQAGWVLPPDDRQAIKAAMHDLVCNGRTQLLADSRPQTEYAQQFRYDRLAQRLAQLLNSVVQP